jgi:hypothetical protein
VPEYVKLELNTIELQYLQASPISWDYPFKRSSYSFQTGSRSDSATRQNDSAYQRSSPPIGQTWPESM